MAASLVEKACVVCGQKSHRVDWQNAQYPACDFHGKDEVQRAISARTPSGK
jgi:hypothetical protein